MPGTGAARPRNWQRYPTRGFWHGPLKSHMVQESVYVYLCLHTAFCSWAFGRSCNPIFCNRNAFSLSSSFPIQLELQVVFSGFCCGHINHVPHNQSLIVFKHNFGVFKCYMMLLIEACVCFSKLSIYVASTN